MGRGTGRAGDAPRDVPRITWSLMRSQRPVISRHVKGHANPRKLRCVRTSWVTIHHKFRWPRTTSATITNKAMIPHKLRSVRAPSGTTEPRCILNYARSLVNDACIPK
eukprot:2144036-Pyramimonas_sp.AAC.1